MKNGVGVERTGSFLWERNDKDDWFPMCNAQSTVKVTYEWNAVHENHKQSYNTGNDSEKEHLTLQSYKEYKGCVSQTRTLHYYASILPK